VGKCKNNKIKTKGTEKSWHLFYIPVFHNLSVYSLFSRVLPWYFTCTYMYFSQSNNLHYSSCPFPLPHNCSTVFSAVHCVLFLYGYNVFQYYSLSTTLFSSSLEAEYFKFLKWLIFFK
jgi:hypothetical protein